MSEGLSGNLAQLPLVDLLKMLVAGGQSGHLELVSGLDKGDIYMAKGELVHAECNLQSGEAAFAQLASWQKGQFHFDSQLNQAPTRTIQKTLDQLLADSARAASEREAVRRVVPNMDVVPRLARKAPAERFTIEAADWEFLANIDGSGTAGDLCQRLRMEESDVARNLYRLKLHGLVEMAVVQQAAPAPRALAGAPFFAALHAAVAGALGPLAEIIIDDGVEDLGFTRANFPRDAVASLAERISSEIRDPEKRVRFQQTMLQMLRGTQQAA